MKYTDFIEINETFQYSINLQFDINNICKIKEYIPTNDSCEMMEYYLDSILGKFNKATTLIGPYGKGKSHLLLILLTLLNDYEEKDKIVLDKLLTKIKNINKSLYEKFQQIRKQKFKYMPVIINSNYNNMNQAFLLALAEALDREKIKDIIVNTYFDVALNVLDKWEREGYSDVIKKFETCLDDSKVTLTELKNKLKMYDEDGYKTFKSVYSCVMHGMEFNPIINTDIIKYYKDVNYNICQRGYNGMIIVFDEFSKFLEYVGNENMMKDLKTLQDFAELASRTGKEEQIIFSCITHKAINEYIKNLKEDKVNAFKTVEGRFKEIYFNRSMEQNYEIISQTINKKSKYKKIILEEIDGKRDFYDEVKSEFSFCKMDDCEKTLFTGCYPLNPLTVYSVINLSEKIAQNERTLFTFLTDDDLTSFKYFVKNEESNHLFNVDRIYDYFKNNFKKENDDLIKGIWIKSENALSKTKNDVEQRILKTLAIIYMMNDFENIAPNDKAIRLANNLEINEYNQAINCLIEKGIIKRKKSSKVYDFSTVYNKEVLNEIDRIANTKFKIINERETLEKIADLGYVIPRKYNQIYKMTRFFKMIYLNEEEFLNLKSLKILKQKYNADGIVINLIRTSTNIVKVIDKVFSIEDKDVVIRIPKEVFSDDFIFALKEYESIEYIKRTQNNDEEIYSELNVIKEENIELIQREIEKRFEKSNVEIYSETKKINTSNMSSIVSKNCEELYCETPIINNEMINKNDISTPIQKARGIVIDAILNDDQSLIKSTTSAEATIYKAVVEKKKNEDIFNIIKLIKEYIKKSEGLEKKKFEPLCVKIETHPYGVRKGVIPILLAIAIEEYSENVILYYQNREVEINSTNISKIIEEPDKYLLRVEKGTAEKDKFVKKLMRIYSCEITDNYRSNIKSLVTCMKKWILSLPRIVRESSTVNALIKEKAFIDIKNELLQTDINNNEFLFQKIPMYLKNEKYDDIAAIMKSFKDVYDKYLEKYTSFLVHDFKELFEHNSKTNLNTLLTNWYKNIDEYAKNTIVKLEIKGVFEYISNLNTYNEEEILQNIAIIVVGTYIEDWQDNTQKEFTSKFEEMLKEIKNIKKSNSCKQEMVVISDGNKEIKKYINSLEISSLGSTLKNNIEDSLEEYGEAISESEKIRILLQIVKKYM